MNIDFEFILFLAVFISGIVILIDSVFFAKKRKQKVNGSKEKLPVIVDYSWSFFPVLFFVFLFRSFVFEPYRIPSGSLEPTLLIGDFILVNKYHYGLRLPVLHRKVLSLNEPKRGDIITFRYPVDPSINYIKRVIGVPNDRISYIDKELYINGAKIPQEALSLNAVSTDQSGDTTRVAERKENLLGKEHRIFVRPDKIDDDFHDVVVPEGYYFVMGDNRDDSYDSRYWGFVPEENIIGQAILVWASVDWNHYRVRWNRIFTWIR